MIIVKSLITSNVRLGGWRMRTSGLGIASMVLLQSVRIPDWRKDGLYTVEIILTEQDDPLG